MSPQVRSLAALFAVLLSCGAGADVLWDNNLTPDGFNGRALSPPAFPEIRVADDFVVPEGEEWVIEGFHAAIIEDSGWRTGDLLDLFVYDTMGNIPGEEIVRVSGAFGRMDTGHEYFSRSAYEYSLEALDIRLDAGTYWIGLRNPDGGGAGTNYWLTSDGGVDGADSSTGYINLGITWGAEGDGWHHAFQITGVPEPSGLALLGIGAAALIRRRR